MSDIEQQRLTQKQQAAIQAMLSEPTITAAAERANVGRRTLTGWLTDETFVSALDEAQQRLLCSHSARLAGLLENAADCYAELLATCEDEATRLRAADSVHRSFDSIASRIAARREMDEFEKRLTELEQARL